MTLRNEGLYGKQDNMLSRFVLMKSRLVWKAGSGGKQVQMESGIIWKAGSYGKQDYTEIKVI